MILKKNVLQLIKKSNPLRRALMDLHDKSEYTILKWLRENSPELTKYNSLQVTAAYLKMEIDEMVIKEEHDFQQVV